MTVPFRDLDFGCATAEEEGVQNPALLTRGYLDLHDVEKEILRGHRYLFLGYKGSGKSAIGEHLRLRAETDATLFVKQILLGNFPFAEFGQIVQGPTSGPARYPTAWSWILLLQLLNSFASDEGADSRNDPDFLKSLDVLRKVGFLPTPSLQEVVVRSSNRAFKTQIPKLVEGSWGSATTPAGFNWISFVETLKAIAERFSTNNRHLLVIDGLDDIFIKGEIQFESLAALVLEVSRLNHAFKQSHSRAKIILLCRTDIYERLPGPNKNKIRQDAAIHLDWYQDPTRPAKSNLLTLANLKARVADKDLHDVLRQHLPGSILSTNGKEKRETRRYLLNHTRHTPRDFLQLLKYIQYHCDERGRVLSHHVRSGVRSYAINYFLPEIKDELVGHVRPEAIDAGVEVLGRLGRKQFTMKQFMDKALEIGRASVVDERFIELLFEFGAVGNLIKTGDDKPFYTYRYRNRHSPFNADRRLTLHRALLPALNIPTII